MSYCGEPLARQPIGRLAFAIFLVYLLSSSWRFPLGGDGRATLATSLSLVTRQTLAIDPQLASDEGYTPRAKIGVDGRAYAKAGVGLPIVEMPFVALALGVSRVTAVPEQQALAAVLSLLNPLLMACTIIAVFRLARSIDCPPPVAMSLAVAYSLGTLAWVYAGVDGTEPLQALCLAGALLFVLNHRSERLESSFAAGGIALTCAVITKPANAVLVPAFVVYVIAVLRSRRIERGEAARILTCVIAPLVAGCVFLVWLNWIRFGSVLETGYEQDAFRNPFFRGVYGLVFSVNKGVIFYSPPVLLAPVGIWLMMRTHRREATLIVLAGVSYVSLFGKYDVWGAGWAFGPRYLVPLIPLLMLPVARAMAAARICRYQGIALFAAGVVVNGLGVLVDGDAYHSAIMNIDLARETGFVQISSAQYPGQLINVPVPPEDVLPRFSEIAGKFWLARVACDRCWCDERTAQCGCRGGAMESNPTFSSPPWAARYPDARPRPPYGSRLINPWIANRIHELLRRRAR